MSGKSAHSRENGQKKCCIAGRKGSVVCKLVCREGSQLTMMSVQLSSVDLNISTHEQLGNLRAGTPVVEIAFFFAL